MTDMTQLQPREARGIKIPAEAGIAFVLLVVMIGGALASPNFLTLSNIIVLLLNGAVIGFLCLGQSFVLFTGGIDLSCGSIVAMTCVLAAVFMDSLGLPWPVAAVAVLAVGALVGAVNGLIIDKTGVPPFIVTFAMMGVAASIPQIVTGAESIRVMQFGYRFIGQARIFGIPFPVIALAIAIAAAAIFIKRTVTGTHIFAVGGNAEAARLAGVNTSRITVLVYAISGFCGACGGLIYGSRLMTGYPTAGRGDELFFSIAGAVVGGVSLFGGIGSVYGAMIGATLIATISNLMNVLNVSAYWQPLVIGVIILVGVTFDTMRASSRLSLPWAKILKKKLSGSA
ncbi:ABC transporter permease [Rhizobium sp. VS19-DR104.2]|uniref:ABC transporter permease n=1 Tax=unclassified Rhizobium TaxID=2613769 RepID=UPI001C5BC25A|nr:MULTISPECIES: ABC transporter permease [unclassified Rhizobium]MBZ5763240.1 ABC transporter permease [Rhizobium sp. VS19-DR96]MBZ5769162.1 ABC transporter permease [Rhizobium sp. VS19-DR129.2]MBZ5776710.1 ABC transporter permease [Rhizobium sp. VS19-DRK62.2]MBZ5787827.1 ABC transporter permease [Rhizobium sp. VS19-DR121]MBZ5805222.1 ABC transporter permease [Rhizobium sp. VS19-DR181]